MKEPLNTCSGIIKGLGYIFSLSGVAAACLLCYNIKTFTIVNPGIAVAAAIFLFIPLKSADANTIQKITAFYLLSVPVNALSGQYYKMHLCSADINISCTVVIILLSATGHWLSILSGERSPATEHWKILRAAWFCGIGIIIFHMGILFLMLKSFYGYGWENDYITIGSLSLYMILFWVLKDRLHNHRFRRISAVVLAFFFISMMIKR